MKPKESTFCVLPWLHLATHPHAGVSLCCRSDHSNNLNMARNEVGGANHFLKLGQDSLSSILNSEYFRQVRKQMLSNEVPQACRGCFHQEKLGVESKRQDEQKYYPLTEERARAMTAADGSIELDLQFVELRLGNNCNLKCRTCNPASSTKWRSDYDTLGKEVGFLRSYDGMDGFDWPEKEGFWEELHDATPNLSALYINGGEPMLYKLHWEYLKKLVSSGRAGNIDLLYSTNVTVLPDMAFDIWKHFKRVRINASVDDIGERNRYIRYPADWDTIVSVLGRLQKGGVELTILQTVSAMNVYYLSDFNAWASFQGIGVSHNFVFDPDYLSVAALPLSVRKRVFQKILPGLDRKRANDLTALFNGPDHPEKWQRFVEYTRALDKIRSEKFEKTFPEFCQLLKEEGYEEF